jgi:hypothetical protein
LISDGERRCPRPWRERNATGTPARVPVKNESEGDPKGVSTDSSEMSSIAERS